MHLLFVIGEPLEEQTFHSPIKFKMHLCVTNVWAVCLSNEPDPARSDSKA